MKKLFTLLLLVSYLPISAQIITTIAGNGIWSYGGDNGQATAAKLKTPSEVTLDAVGNIYIADYDNNRIRKINSLGIISTIAGTGTAGFSGDGGQATAAKLHQPEHIAFDASGNMYIADTGNERVRKVSTTGVITTIAGNGGTGFNGDGMPATAAQLYSPEEVALDASGNVYIADYFNNPHT